MIRKTRSIRFPHASQLRRMLGLNPGKLPKERQEFAKGGLCFILAASGSLDWRGARRPHRLLVQCNVCGEIVSAGRFNQHQGMYGMDMLSEFSKDWINGGEQRYWAEQASPADEGQ